MFLLSRETPEFFFALAGKILILKSFREPKQLNQFLSTAPDLRAKTISFKNESTSSTALLYCITNSCLAEPVYWKSFKIPSVPSVLGNLSKPGPFFHSLLYKSSRLRLSCKFTWLPRNSFLSSSPLIYLFISCD